MLEKKDDKGFLGRNVLGLSFTSLLTDISSESVYAVLPFYITSLGFGKEIVGLVEGLGELFASAFKFLSGYITQRIMRYKLLTLIGYLFSSMAKPFFAIARSGYEIALIKVLDRVGKGIRTSPRDALLASSVKQSVRGKAFGFHRALDTVGALVGPLLAIFLLIHFGYIGVFLFSLIPGLAAVLILYFIVQEPREIIVSSIEASGGLTGGFTSLYWIFILTVILSGLTGYTQAFLLLRAREIGWSESFSIGFLVLANTVYALFAYPVGFYSDVFRRGTLYPLIFLIEIMGVSVIIYYSNMYVTPIFFIFYGLYMAFHDTLIRVMTTKYIAEYLKGMGYGIMHSSYGFSALIGYYIMGWLYQVYGYRVAFTYSLIVGVIGFIVSIILVYKTKS